MRGYLACCRSFILTGLLLCNTAGAVYGYIQVDIADDFDINPAEGVWTSYYGWTVVGQPSSVVNPGGWLNIAFTNTTERPDSSWWDITKTPATNLLAGACLQATNFVPHFDFWASNVVPNSVSVRWMASTNGNIWSNELNLPSAQGEWTAISSAEEQFLADLEAEEWIGLDVERNTAGQQFYGLDNAMLMVPEPGQILMLSAVALAALRNRRRRAAKGGGSWWAV